MERQPNTHWGLGEPWFGGFQDITGQGARQSDVGSPSHEKSDQRNFGGPFQMGYSMILFYFICDKAIKVLWNAVFYLWLCV